MVSDVCAALAIIEEDGPTQGLHVNIAKSLLHIPVGDLDQSELLISRILERVSEASEHLAYVLMDLATAAERHDCVSIEDVDVPL